MTRGKKIVTVVFLACVGLILLVFFLPKDEWDKKKVLAFFEDNSKILLGTAEQLTEGTISSKDAVRVISRAADVKKDYIAISEKGSLDIYIDGHGIAPAGADCGLVYFPTDDLTDFQWYNDDFKLYVKEGKGYYTDNGTDDTIYLEEFREHWYYYYVTF